MGEGVAMRHTCNRRVEDAEEVGPPRGGPPGWRGVGPLSPSNALRLQTARGKSALSHSILLTADFACPREAGRLRRLRGPAKNARGQQKTKVSVEHGQACTCSNGMQGRAHLFRCLLMPAAFGVSMGGSTAGHGAPVGTRLGIEARRSSWRVLLGTVSKNAGKLLIRLEKRLRGEGLFWKVFALFNPFPQMRFTVKQCEYLEF